MIRSQSGSIAVAELELSAADLDYEAVVVVDVHVAVVADRDAGAVLDLLVVNVRLAVYAHRDRRVVDAFGVRAVEITDSDGQVVLILIVVGGVDQGIRADRYRGVVRAVGGVGERIVPDRQRKVVFGGFALKVIPALGKRIEANRDCGVVHALGVREAAIADGDGAIATLLRVAVRTAVLVDLLAVIADADILLGGGGGRES